jgi:hypothetical protein
MNSPEHESLFQLDANYSTGAACVMPIAKVLNLWDRTLGICIMVLIAIMGLIMMACCNNIATYCAAQVSIHQSP